MNGPVFVRALVVAALGLGAATGFGALLAAQAPKEAQAPREAGSESAQAQEGGRDESLARAREEVEVLELRVGAKRAELRQAEARLALERAQLADYDKVKRLKIASDVGQKRARLQVLEAEAERALRQAELTDAEKRFEQARRRVAMIGRRGPAGAGIVETIGRDLGAMKERLERMEKRLDLFEDGLEATREDVRRIELILEKIHKKLPS